jgi:hypothetical protein
MGGGFRSAGARSVPWADRHGEGHRIRALADSYINVSVRLLAGTDFPTLDKAPIIINDNRHPKFLESNRTGAGMFHFIGSATIDTVAGILVTALALVTIVTLVLWSRREIDRIARRGYGSAREILKENGDRD